MMETKQENWKSLAKKDELTQAQLLDGLIKEADAVVIGVGAGMSEADGFTYIGKRFNDAFPDFIEKYKFLDMLQASLFEFENPREYWAFQSRFVLMNYFDQPVGDSYVRLKQILADKDYHVITTNADNGFHAAGFDMKKVFHIQGEYGLQQCVNHCHQQTYQDEALMRKMVDVQKDMLVPEELVPHCPKCGEPLEVNKRTVEKGMVEDDYFHKQKGRYEQFLQDHEGERILFLEIGVGNTTPQFIKHPFQEMTAKNTNALYVTMNEREYFIPRDVRTRSIHIDEHIRDVIEAIAK